MTILLLLTGLALLAIGGDVLVRGAVAASSRLGVSPLLAGLTIVGFGTSTPELVTSLFAAFNGSPGIAVGNVVGSNIANILLILGVSAVILPLAIQRQAFLRDGGALWFAALVCTAVILVGSLDRSVGLVLVALLIGYIIFAYVSERRPNDVEGHRHENEAASVSSSMSLSVALGLSAVGIAATVFGARLLVDAASEIARDFGVTETVIGLTVVAIGTSLPELVACVIAALRKQADVAIGNVVGSNIYNIFGILGVTALVHPIEVPAEIAAFDIWVLLGTTALLILFLRTGWTLKRWEGVVFLALYALYTGYLIL